MATAGNGWRTYLLAIAAVLAAYGVQGTVRTAIAQSVAEARIDNIEAQQEKQEKLISKGLDKINIKLDGIAESISDQKVDAAKSHHTHSPR